MIQLGAFFGSEFNQNGDLGNLEVLSKALDPLGNEVTLRPDLRTSDELLSADFLVVGDASRAHLRLRKSELDDLVRVIELRAELGRWTLLVGSSYEFFSSVIFGERPAELVERRSGFYSHNREGHTFWGYINSQIQLPPVVVRGSLIGTQFFGPFLARNSFFIDEIASRLRKEADQTFLSLLHAAMQSSPNFLEAKRNLL